jgi:hypothetical protein
MQQNTIVLFGARCPHERRRELLFGRPITYGIAQLSMTPFVTYWTAAGDIVSYDERFRITNVVLRNSRFHYGRYCVTDLNELQIGRRAERLGRYLSANLVDPTFVGRFPGTFSMSIDRRVPLERMMELTEQSPVPFELLSRRGNCFVAFGRSKQGLI